MEEKIINILKQFEQRDYERGGVSLAPEMYEAVAIHIHSLFRETFEFGLPPCAPSEPPKKLLRKIPMRREVVDVEGTLFQYTIENRQVRYQKIASTLLSVDNLNF